MFSKIFGEMEVLTIDDDGYQFDEEDYQFDDGDVLTKWW